MIKFGKLFRFEKKYIEDSAHFTILIQIFNLWSQLHFESPTDQTMTRFL